MGGSFPDTMRIVSDPDEGALIESFEYRTFGNLLFTVICDDQDKTNELQNIFLTASKLRPSDSVKNGLNFEQKNEVGKAFHDVYREVYPSDNFVVVTLEKLGQSID